MPAVFTSQLGTARQRSVAIGKMVGIRGGHAERAILTTVEYRAARGRDPRTPRVST